MYLKGATKSRAENTTTYDPQTQEEAIEVALQLAKAYNIDPKLIGNHAPSQ